MKKFRFSSEQLLENKKWRPSAEIFEASTGNGDIKEIGFSKLFDTKDGSDKFVKDYGENIGFLESEIEEKRPFKNS